MRKDAILFHTFIKIGDISRVSENKWTFAKCSVDHLYDDVLFLLCTNITRATDISTHVHIVTGILVWQNIAIRMMILDFDIRINISIILYSTSMQWVDKCMAILMSMYFFLKSHGYVFNCVLKYSECFKIQWVHNRCLKYGDSILVKHFLQWQLE